MHNKIKAVDLNIEYSVDYRSIKHPRLEFKTGNLLLVLPLKYQGGKNLLEKHKLWVNNKRIEIFNALEASKNKKLNLNRSEKEFREIAHDLFHQHLRKLNLDANIKFRSMKSKWASCSPAKNVTINKLLKYLPDNLISYVIYHEITHLSERKHNERFWNFISQKFKDYREKEKELFVYWFLTQKLIK